MRVFVVEGFRTRRGIEFSRMQGPVTPRGVRKPLVKHRYRPHKTRPWYVPKTTEMEEKFRRRTRREFKLRTLKPRKSKVRRPLRKGSALKKHPRPKFIPKTVRQEAVDAEERNLRVAKVFKKSRTLKTASRMAYRAGDNEKGKNLAGKSFAMHHVAKAHRPGQSPEGKEKHKVKRHMSYFARYKKEDVDPEARKARLTKLLWNRSRTGHAARARGDERSAGRHSAKAMNTYRSLQSLTGKKRRSWSSL